MKLYLKMGIVCALCFVIALVTVNAVEEYEYNKYLYTLEYEIRDYGFHDIGNGIFYDNMNRNEYDKMLRCWEEGGDVSSIDADWDAIEIIEKSYKH